MIRSILYSLVLLLFFVPASYGVNLSAQALHDALAVKFEGSDKAPVTIVEYSSLTCPYCAHFSSSVYPTIKKEYIDTGKVKFVFASFPIEGYVAVQAEMLARCVVPSDYVAMRHAIFGAQDRWLYNSIGKPAVATTGPYKGMTADQKEFFVTLAKMEGVGLEKIEACLSNKTLEKAILQSRVVGEKEHHITATPTFIVNGKSYVGFQGVEDMRKAINKALAATTLHKAGNH